MFRDTKKSRPHLGKTEIKGGKFGHMKGIGYGGPRVGEGYFKAPYGSSEAHYREKIARMLYDALDEEDRASMFPGIKHASRVTQDLASFVTVNFSHAKDLDDGDVDAKALLHRDPQDKSSTVLWLYQDPTTPVQHQVLWFCEEECDGSAIIEPQSIAGGCLCVFNGKRDLHGVIPPRSFNSDFPWYGATLLRKSNRHRDNERKKATKRKRDATELKVDGEGSDESLCHDDALTGSVAVSMVSLVG